MELKSASTRSGSWEKATVTVLPPDGKGIDPPGPLLVFPPVVPPPQEANKMLASANIEIAR